MPLPCTPPWAAEHRGGPPVSSPNAANTTRPECSAQVSPDQLVRACRGASAAFGPWRATRDEQRSATLPRPRGDHAQHLARCRGPLATSRDHTDPWGAGLASSVAGMAEWSFLTSPRASAAVHRHDPGTPLIDIAAALSITERSAYAIVDDLARAGYVVKTEDGRRNRYEVQGHLPLPDRVSRSGTIGEVLALLAGDSGAMPSVA